MLNLDSEAQLLGNKALGLARVIVTIKWRAGHVPSVDWRDHGI